MHQTKASTLDLTFILHLHHCKLLMDILVSLCTFRTAVVPNTDIYRMQIGLLHDKIIYWKLTCKSYLHNNFQQFFTNFLLSCFCLENWVTSYVGMCLFHISFVILSVVFITRSWSHKLWELYTRQYWKVKEKFLVIYFGDNSCNEV